jgi:hydroxyacylglutathione hydrolase
MRSVLAATAILAGLLGPSSSSAQLTPGTMDVHWNEGAPDCAKSSQPALQVHAYNPQTFILRENPCATAEAPFMYLLVGSSRALLIDTGDVADPKQMPLASTVSGLLPRVGTGPISLLIVHTHGHLDHRLGDPQFANLPNVEIVATDLDHVRKFFGFSNWPEGIAQVDLGNRILDAIPTPGHYPSEVSYYDRETGLVFSGDFFLPGRLIIDNAAADLASAKRVAEFIKDRPVSYVLGGHIELNADGDAWSLGYHYHPNEHVLQLSKQDLLNLPNVLGHFNGFYSQSGMFVMYNQSRVLLAMAIVLILLFVMLGMLLRWYFRRRKKRRLAFAS